MRAAIYTVESTCSGAICGTFVASSTIVTPEISAGQQWVRFEFSPSVDLSAGDYYLGIHSASRHRAWFYNNEDGAPGWFFGWDFDSRLPTTGDTSSTTTGRLTIFAERSTP